MNDFQSKLHELQREVTILNSLRTQAQDSSRIITELERCMFGLNVPFVTRLPHNDALGSVAVVYERQEHAWRLMVEMNEDKRSWRMLREQPLQIRLHVSRYADLITQSATEAARKHGERLAILQQSVIG